MGRTWLLVLGVCSFLTPVFIPADRLRVLPPGVTSPLLEDKVDRGDLDDPGRAPPPGKFIPKDVPKKVN